QCVSDLPLLSDEERHRVLVRWNQTSTDFPRNARIDQLFAAQAALSPEAVAVEFQGVRWTYRELDAHANDVARHLHSLGVGPGSRIGLCVERSLEMVAGMLGILKAGAAYVPLDPTYPSERLAFMVKDAECTVVLTLERLMDIVSNVITRSDD